MELHVVLTEARAEARDSDKLEIVGFFEMAIGDMTASSNERWADSAASFVAQLQHSMTGVVRWRRVTAPACIDSKPRRCIETNAGIRVE